MKKLFTILLAVILIAAMFAGCGKKDDGFERAAVQYPVPTVQEQSTIMLTAAQFSAARLLTRTTALSSPSLIR